MTSTPHSGSSLFFIETWGCQMNELDSQRMAGQLLQQGFLPTSIPQDADVILLNSCSIREKAEQKVYSRLGEYRVFKNEKPDLLIGLCGCVAQQEGEKALRRVPDLDFVIGPARVGELREVLAQRRTGRRPVAIGFPEQRDFELDTISRDSEYKGMVTIVEGCNKKCTFCVVPSTRGPEYSRRMEDILSDVRHLVAYGFLEIELLGQTVNHWKDPGTQADFADLLDAVAQIPGVRRLRFVTSYPRDFSPRMVEQLALHPNISSYLHLPVQSGSDRILQRMGRGYTVASYLDLVEQLRQARTDLALSTDIIVGFPGETDHDFEQTLQLVNEARFAAMFAFCYSERPGTAAPRLDGKVDPDLAQRRLRELLALQNSIQRELNQAQVGLEHEVLVTGVGKGQDTWTGRTACHRIVHFSSQRFFRLGSTVRVRIEKSLTHSLMASLVESMELSKRQSAAPLLPVVA